MTWVEVARAPGLPFAHILKGKLETEGIPVKLEYEVVGQIAGLTVNGLGEVRILVPEEYEEEARRLLQEPPVL